MAKKFNLIGYEDCNIIVLSNIFFSGHGKTSESYYFNPEILEDEYLLGSSLGKYDLSNPSYYMPSHDEILDEAKTLYVHPSCTLSRTLLSKKYKKSLNPWLADAVVVPKPDANQFSWRRNVLIFYSKDTDTYYILLNHHWTDLKGEDIPKGTIFNSLIPAETMDNISRRITQIKFDVSDLLGSKFVEETAWRNVPARGKWFTDALLGVIPKNKIVYEDAVVKSLNDKESDIDFENLNSIREMLLSSDRDTKLAGMKALAMLNYMQYPQSVKYVLNNTLWNWRYDGINTSTAVKYMLKALTGNGGGKYIRFYDKFISQKDWDLFKQLITGNDSFSPNAYGFLFFDSNMKLTPRLKD